MWEGKLDWVVGEGMGGLDCQERECERLDQSELEFKYSWQNSTRLLFVGWLKKGRRAGSTCCSLWQIWKPKKTPELHFLWPVHMSESVRGAANIWPHITVSFKRVRIVLKVTFPAGFSNIFTLHCKVWLLAFSQAAIKSTTGSSLWGLESRFPWERQQSEHMGTRYVWKWSRVRCLFVCLLRAISFREVYSSFLSSLTQSKKTKSSLRWLLVGDFPTFTAPQKFKKNTEQSGNHF